MKELEALSKQILSRVEEEGKQKVSQKEKELSVLLEENRIRLVEQQKARKKAIEARSKAEYDRQVQSMRNEKRNQLLKEKQIILTTIYEEAIEKMSDWDTASFESFVTSVLKQFESRNVRLILGEKTAKHFTASFRDILRRSHSGLSIESTTIPNKAGFIVEAGGVDYNYFFDQMIAEIKRDFSPKLASLAFQKNE